MDRHAIATRILGASIIMGIICDALLRTESWGLNALLCNAALILVAYLLIHRSTFSAPRQVGWLAVCILLFSTGLALRDSPTLKWLSGSGLFVCYSLLVLDRVPLRLASVNDYIRAFFTACFNAVFGSFPLFLTDLKTNSEGRRPWTSNARMVSRGLLVATPFLAVFVILFSSADAVFSHAVSSLFNFDIPDLIEHVALVALIGWVIAGYLRRLLTGEGLRFVAEAEPVENNIALKITDVAIPIALLDLLFLLFAVIQFRYLFGGAARVSQITGLTYSEYARRGFFELVAVTALVLPMLLAFHWLVRKETAGRLKVFNVLAAIQVGLLFVIMASALQRMRIYTLQYGLTELRVYTTAFMFWLAVVFIWFVGTVLIGRRPQFAFGALAAGFLVIAALFAANPDALIVKANIARVAAGNHFDANYNSSLSADSVPGLVAGIDSLSGPERRIVAQKLLDEYGSGQSFDWRSWDLGRARAVSSVKDNLQKLTQFAGAQ